MSLGMAEELFESDPEAARRTVSEARVATSAAIADLRSVVRGIHPPVLADRGLDGAIRALALDMAVPVEVVGVSGWTAAGADRVRGLLRGRRVPRELGQARRAPATPGSSSSHEHGLLRVVVSDDGRGGADVDSGTGMRGVMRRLAAFDGTMTVSSPDGGPTIVTLEVPCVLSSPKTTPSSALA